MNNVCFQHKIADIRIKTNADVEISYIQNRDFEKFLGKDKKDEIYLNICKINNGSFSNTPLDSHKRKALNRCLGFQTRWMDNPIFRNPEFRTVIQRCLAQPEMVHIALNWNRAIIRNFAQNEFFYFYPPEKRKEFADPIFRARYRNFIAPALIKFLAVMIHGAGVICNQKVAVFLAPDGGGKTTVVNHSDVNGVLSDDQVVLRKEGNGIMAHSTPFGFTTCGPQKAELGGFFLLEKADSFKLNPIDANDILQFIWNDQRFRWYVLPKSIRLEVFDMLYHICHQVPVYRMQFAKDFVDWEAIDRALEN